MRKQACAQANSSCIGGDDEQRNEGLAEKVTVIKTAEGPDVTTQRSHAQATVFSHRRDVASSVIRPKDRFIYCDCTGDFIGRSRFLDFQSSLHETGNAQTIVCAVFNVSFLPTWTAVEVAGLRREGAVVEIRVVAALPED